MANFKFFADINGQTIELKSVFYRGKTAFGGPTDFIPTYDRLAQKWNRGEIAATRVVEYKKNASKHVCDDRCVNATGRVMKCECSCGGKNHGKGHSHAEAA